MEDDWQSIFRGPSDFDRPDMYLDEAVEGYVSGSRGRPGFTESPSVQRVRPTRQMACDKRECRGVTMTAEEEGDDNIAWMMNYLKGCGHNNGWAMLGHLIDNGVLNIVLSPMAMSLLSEWEYERIEALEEEAEREAGEARQLELWLEDEFIKSLWSGGVLLCIREASVTVTHRWLEDQFQDSLQRDEAALQGRVERLLAYLAREESLKPWLEEQFMSDLYAADLKLGMRRDMAKVWSVRDEDPMEAAATIVVVEGWCLRHLVFLKGQRWSQQNVKWTASLLEALRFLHIG